MTAAPYAVVDVDAELGGNPAEREEPLGTKEKFWYRRPDDDRWLLKLARDGTGEDWAERIAADVARRLGLPHAEVELAVYRGRRAVVVRDFTGSGARPLVHGNELLWELDPSYPRERAGRLRDHTVERIARALEKLWHDASNDRLPAGVVDAVGLFAGYLMLDALILNTDRHHENWAAETLLDVGDMRVATLAPTYDHASSLGRELSDESRNRKLRQPDGTFDVTKYVERARSASYATGRGEARPLSPVEAFRAFSALRPDAGRAWLRVLAASTAADFGEAVDAVPDARMSAPEKDLARGILTHTRLQLLEARRV